MLEQLFLEAGQARSAGDNDQAARLYEQATKICEKDPNEVNNLAFSLQALAEIYSEGGQYDRVIPVYKRLIVLGSKVLGENHPDLIDTAVHLARALEANKQYAQADEIFKLAASRAERALGLSHPVAQEIRQEYFNILANRDSVESVEEDALKLGLVPLPAAKSAPTSMSKPVPAGEKAVSEQPPKTTERVKKPTSARQPKKIKNLRYGAESAEKEASNLLNIHVLRHRWRSVLYVASVIAGIAAITIALSSLIVPSHLSAASLIAEQLIEKGSFQSVDEINGVQFIDNRYVILNADVQHRKIPYYLLQGNISDIWAVLLSTVVTKENWYQFKGDELMSEESSVFYASGSPEFVVAKKMQVFADAAQRYYNNHGCYPDKSEKIQSEPGLMYINPFTSKADPPGIKRVNGNFGRDTIFPGVKADASVNDCYAFLEQGGSWHEQGSPGKISGLALYSNQRCADGYKVNEFYVHGYDRDAQLITSGKPHTYLVLGFYGGKSLSNGNRGRLEAIEHLSVHMPRRIYIMPGDSTDLQFMHQLGTTLLTAIVLISCAAWIFFGLRRRLKQPDMPIQAVDVIFALSLIFWGTSFIIHLLG